MNGEIVNEKRNGIRIRFMNVRSFGFAKSQNSIMYGGTRHYGEELPLQWYKAFGLKSCCCQSLGRWLGWISQECRERVKGSRSVGSKPSNIPILKLGLVHSKGNEKSKIARTFFGYIC